jgi:hypothetical protein
MKLGLETTDLLGHLGTAWRESIGMRYPPDRPFRLLTSAEFVGGWQPPPEHEVELRSAIHKIGQALFDLHGIEAMQQAHEEIFQEHGPVIARYIEIGFEGVGGGRFKHAQPTPGTRENPKLSASTATSHPHDMGFAFANQSQLEGSDGCD